MFGPWAWLRGYDGETASSSCFRRALTDLIRANPNADPADNVARARQYAELAGAVVVELEEAELAAAKARKEAEIKAENERYAEEDRLRRERQKQAADAAAQSSPPSPQPAPQLGNRLAKTRKPVAKKVLAKRRR